MAVPALGGCGQPGEEACSHLLQDPFAREGRHVVAFVHDHMVSLASRKSRGVRSRRNSSMARTLPRGIASKSLVWTPATQLARDWSISALNPGCRCFQRVKVEAEQKEQILRSLTPISASDIGLACHSARAT